MPYYTRFLAAVPERRRSWPPRTSRKCCAHWEGLGLLSPRPAVARGRAADWSPSTTGTIPTSIDQLRAVARHRAVHGRRDAVDCVGPAASDSGGQHGASAESPAGAGRRPGASDSQRCLVGVCRSRSCRAAAAVTSTRRLMELGSTLCTPRARPVRICPVAVVVSDPSTRTARSNPAAANGKTLRRGARGGGRGAAPMAACCCGAADRASGGPDCGISRGSRCPGPGIRCRDEELAAEVSSADRQSAGYAHACSRRCAHGVTRFRITLTCFRSRVPSARGPVAREMRAG